MNELQVVVDIQQHPQTHELIISKQKLAFTGDAHLVGPTIQSRVEYPSSAVNEGNGAIRLHRRVEPFFHSLGASTQRAILATLDSVRQTPTMHWQEIGVEELQEPKGTFSVEVVGVVVFFQTDAPQNLEVTDMLNRATLDRYWPIEEESP
jgi:hypothetical protein